MTLDRRLGALAVCLALGWTGLISAPTLRGAGDLFETFEHGLVDWRIRTFGPRAPPDGLVIVALDDATHAVSTVGAERRQLTELVEALAASGARVMALDILLADAGPPELDRRLSEALADIPTVIAGAAGGISADGRLGIPHATQELWPQDRFGDAADLGLVNIITDTSGMPRYVPTVFATSRGILQSLPLRAASEFHDADPQIEVGAMRMGERRLSLDHGYLLPLRPYGPSGSIRTVSAVDYLSDDTTPPRLEGKLVVLGSTATGMGDRFPSPFGGDVTGVEVIATAIGHYLESQQVLARSVATRRLDAVAAGLLAVLCTLSVLIFPLARGVLIAGSLLLAWMVAVWGAFAFGIWLAAALPLAAAAGPAALATGWRYARERSQALATDRAMTELKKFQSPQLAEIFEADPTFLSTPETRQATILFVDLAAFTAMSQEIGPKGSEGLLKQFHRRVTHVVRTHGGLVVNYMGDGALAAFGLLDGVDRPNPGALAAAFELVDGVRALDEELGFEGRLTCRVGLHFGTVILSRLGDDLQQQFSVSGDSVNLTSRLLEVAKTEAASIVATATALGPADPQGTRPPDLRRTVTLRGRHGEVDVLLWMS